MEETIAQSVDLASYEVILLNSSVLIEMSISVIACATLMGVKNCPALSLSSSLSMTYSPKRSPKGFSLKNSRCIATSVQKNS